MKKLSLFFVFLLLTSLVSAALEDGLENAADKLEKGADSVEILEEKKWDYLGDEWKNLFLTIPLIKRIDNIFHQMNPFSVFFLARDYDLSPTFFLAVLFSIASVLTLWKFTVWFEEPSLKFVISLLGTIILAHLQLFNVLATLTYRVVLYKSSAVWTFFSLVIIVVAYVFYLYLIKIFNKKMIAARRLSEARINKKKIEDQEKFTEELRKGLKD